MMPESVYQPFSCSFHDRLEDWAIRRVPVELVWLEEGIEKTATERIADVFAQDGADHLRLDSGEVIRLDKLLSVERMLLSDAR